MSNNNYKPTLLNTDGKTPAARLIEWAINDPDLGEALKQHMKESLPMILDDKIPLDSVIAQWVDKVAELAKEAELIGNDNE